MFSNIYNLMYLLYRNIKVYRYIYAMTLSYLVRNLVLIIFLAPTYGILGG